METFCSYSIQYVVVIVVNSKAYNTATGTDSIVVVTLVLRIFSRQLLHTVRSMYYSKFECWKDIQYRLNHDQFKVLISLVGNCVFSTEE